MYDFVTEKAGYPQDQKGNFCTQGDTSLACSIAYFNGTVSAVAQNAQRVSKRPLLLDLFSGAGGAARGYYDAGFEVIGVDIAPQKNYPYTFFQANALDVLNMLESGVWQGYTLANFAAIHASVPCQEYSCTRHLRNAVAAAPRIREKLVDVAYGRLRALGLPWVIENVPGAPMPDSITLCGSMFGLPIRRHRWFACSHYLYAPGPCRHTDSCINVIGGKICGYGALRSQTLYHTAKGETRRREAYFRSDVGEKAMGIDWMTRAELSEAIPPAYTHWIGLQLMAIVESEAAA